NDDRHDVDDDDDDDGNIRGATGSVHDGDDDDAMAHPSHRPTSQTLSPTLPTQLTVMLKQIVLISYLQHVL
ncbi:unnamed protein product, partial [Acanthocheilonema viteae]